MTQRIEQRWLNDYKVPDIEVRADEAGGGKIITGHGAVFNRTSQNLGGFVEEVAPSAFTKTLQEADVRALINHDANLLLGRNRSDTLKLAEDNIGLRYDITAPDTTAGRDWMVLLERGDISQSSFSFRVINDEWGLTADDFPKRTLLEVALFDVGPVTFPAYVDADAGVGQASRAALATLAERRSEKLETILELAQHGELRDLIRDGQRPSGEQRSNKIVLKSDASDEEKRSAVQSEVESRDVNPVAGSFQAITKAIREAVQAWAEEQSGSRYVYVNVEATFADTVIVSLFGGSWDWDGESFQFDYSIDSDGNATLGEAKAVQLEVTFNDKPADDGGGRSNVAPEAEQRSPLSVQKARLALLQRSAPKAI